MAGTAAVKSCIPLINELCSDMSFPTGEGTTNSVLNIVNSAVQLILLVVVALPEVGK
jgi:hypothetical protein